MGRIVHLGKVRDFVRTTPVFRALDIEVLTGDRAYSSLLLHNMVKRGELNRITKGWYSTSDDPSVAVFAFRPAYVGLQEALSVRDLWEQETNVVIVTRLAVRPGVRSVMGSNVVLHRIDGRYFFGFEYVDCGGVFLPVSDLEKTLIDLAYYGELPGRDVLRRLTRMADKARLRRYLLRYPKRFRVAVKATLA